MKVGEQLPAVREWWRLPSERIVAICRLSGEGALSEAVVRYVDEHGSMSTTPFTLTASFIANHCRKVAHG